MPDFSAKAGDTAPTWSDTLTYSNGNAANLTGASVQLVVRSWNSPAPLFNSAATIVAPDAMSNSLGGVSKDAEKAPPPEGSGAARRRERSLDQSLLL